MQVNKHGNGVKNHSRLAAETKNCNGLSQKTKLMKFHNRTLEKRKRQSDILHSCLLSDVFYSAFFPVKLKVRN